MDSPALDDFASTILLHHSSLCSSRDQEDLSDRSQWSDPDSLRDSSHASPLPTSDDNQRLFFDSMTTTTTTSGREGRDAEEEEDESRDARWIAHANQAAMPETLEATQVRILRESQTRLDRFRRASSSTLGMDPEQSPPRIPQQEPESSPLLPLPRQQQPPPQQPSRGMPSAMRDVDTAKEPRSPSPTRISSTSVPGHFDPSPNIEPPVPSTSISTTLTHSSVRQAAASSLSHRQDDVQKTFPTSTSVPHASTSSHSNSKKVSHNRTPSRIREDSNRNDSSSTRSKNTDPSGSDVRADSFSATVRASSKSESTTGNGDEGTPTDPSNSLGSTLSSWDSRETMIRKFQRSIESLSKQVNDLQMDMKRRDIELAQLNLSVSDRDREIQGLNGQISKLEKKVNDERDNSNRLRQIADLERENAEREIQKKSNISRKEMERLEREAQMYLNLLRESDLKVKAMQKSLHDYESIRQELDDARKEYWIVKDELRDLHTEREQMLELIPLRERKRFKQRHNAYSSNDSSAQPIDSSETEIEKLHARLRDALEELYVIQTENDRLQKELQSVRRELETSQVKEEEFSRKLVEKGRRVRSLTSEIRKLESSLNSASRLCEVERKGAHHRIESTNEEFSKNVSSLQNVIETQKREISHLRRLAQTILSQRSTLEQFFHESIEMVRRELMKKSISHNDTSNHREKMGSSFPVIDRSKRRNRRISTSVPPVRGPIDGSSHMHSPPDIHERRFSSSVSPAFPSSHSPSMDSIQLDSWNFDILNMSWEDREQVLRFLFQKLSRRSVPTISSADPISSSPPPEFDTSSPPSPSDILQTAPTTDVHDTPSFFVTQ